MTAKLAELSGIAISYRSLPIDVVKGWPTKGKREGLVTIA